MMKNSLNLGQACLWAGALTAFGACTGTEVPESCEEAGPELCGNAIDDDCDGEIDEATAIDAVEWYQDCDGDGYAPADAEMVTACNGPQITNTCEAWTLMRPSAAANTIDCNDQEAVYHPFAAYQGVGGAVDGDYDFNCSGEIETAPYFVGTNGQQYRACRDVNDCDCYAPMQLPEEEGDSVTPEDILWSPLECGAVYAAIHRVPVAFGCDEERDGEGLAVTIVRPVCR